MPWERYAIRGSELPRRTCPMFLSGFTARIKPDPASPEEAAWAYPWAVGSQRLTRGRLKFRARSGTAQFCRCDGLARTVEGEISTQTCPDVASTVRRHTEPPSVAGRSLNFIHLLDTTWRTSSCLQPDRCAQPRRPSSRISLVASL